MQGEGDTDSSKLDNEASFIQSVTSTKAYGSQQMLYGVLERPAAYISFEEVSYKVAILGKSGVGKTSFISSLSGFSPKSPPTDTVGIRVTDIYWPVKIWNKHVLFKLQFWDAGENWSKKYGHISHACQDKSDIRVYMFSHEDSKSFNEVSKMIVAGDRAHVATLVIGTRHSGRSEVLPSDIRDFEIAHRLRVLSLPLKDPSGDGYARRLDAVLNKISEQLWIRDQQYIMNQSVTV